MLLLSFLLKWTQTRDWFNLFRARICVYDYDLRYARVNIALMGTKLLSYRTCGKRSLLWGIVCLVRYLLTPFLNILKNPNFFVRWQRCQFRNDGVKISIIKVSRQGEKSGGPCIFIQMRHFLRIRRGIYGGPYKCVINRRSFGHYSLSQLPFQSEDHEMSQDVEAISSILKHGI